MIGGNQGLGVGQQWQDLTGSRAFGVTYYNTTGRPIMVRVAWIAGVSAIYTNSVLTIGGVSTTAKRDEGDSIRGGWDEFIVPVGSDYRITVTADAGTPTVRSWAELR